MGTTTKPSHAPTFTNKSQSSSHGLFQIKISTFSLPVDDYPTWILD